MLLDGDIDIHSAGWRNSRRKLHTLGTPGIFIKSGVHNPIINESTEVHNLRRDYCIIRLYMYSLASLMSKQGKCTTELQLTIKVSHGLSARISSSDSCLTSCMRGVSDTTTELALHVAS